jgi:hypothetical protein
MASDNVDPEGRAARRRRPVAAVRRGHLGRRVGKPIVGMGRPGQGRVLRQDPPLQILELGTGIDPELLGQRHSGISIDLERSRLPAGPVEGDHEQTAQALPQGVCGDETFQLRREIGVPAEGQIDVDPLFECREPSALDPHGLVAGEALVSKVGERLPAKERERFAKERGLAGRFGRRVGLLDKALEPTEVDLLRRDSQQIARRPGLDQLGPERLAQR